MAVRAQYPSNHVLSNRNGQESHEQSGFIDKPTNMLFNVGEKREVAGNSMNHQHQFLIQPPIRPHHRRQELIELSQLNNNNQRQQQLNGGVSTGLGLSFDNQLSQNYHQNPYMHPQKQSILEHTPVLSGLIKRQRDEFDQFLQEQGEQFMRTLADKRRKHYHTLMGVVEESAIHRLREKEKEIEIATRRHSQLQARASQMTKEAREWELKARSAEATVASLHEQLQQAAVLSGGGVEHDSKREDGLGCAEDAESAYVDPDRVVVVVPTEPKCKACRKQRAVVLLLPCRHLCLCTECGRVAQVCPICLTFTHCTVEVFLS